MLSEHGSLGLLALVLLVSVIITRFTSKLPSTTKAFILGMTVWTVLYMFHAATRLVAPSFLFGLSSATFLLTQINDE